jgi:hypothetical protein
MTTDLKHTHRKRALYDGVCGCTHSGEADNGGHAEKAITSHKTKLYERQSDRIAKLLHYGLSSV